MSQATHIARPVGALASSHGAPDAMSWATVVARGMVSVSPDMPDERKAAARAIIERLINRLRVAFEEAQAKSSAGEILSLARALMVDVRKTFAGSYWEVWALSDIVDTEFERYLIRNLAQSAHLHLVME